MKLIDNLLYYISVPKCACCGERLSKDELALCKECKEEYNNVLRRNCSVCAKPLYECPCTNDYLDSHYIHKVIKVFRYVIKENLPTNALIYSLKKDNRRDVLKYLSSELADSIAYSVKAPEAYVFTSVPRRKASVIKYGIDHAELLARAVAKRLGAKYKKVLISKSKSEQKRAGSREERLKNTEFRIKKKSIDLSGNNVILIDDIITTGASMSAAAMLLKGLGAKQIIGASLAIAYKDTQVFYDLKR